MQPLADLTQPSAALATPLQWVPPVSDTAELANLPERRRNEVVVALKLLGRVHALRGEGHDLRTAAETVAAGSRHLMRGCSASSLIRKYYLYLGSADDTHPVGNWRVLVNHYCGPTSQPAEFATYVKRMAEDNHRSQAEAFDAIRRLWAEGMPIPGYGTWLEYYAQQYPERPLPKTWPRGYYPLGWSKRNLLRYAPTKGARALVQRGFAAAKKHFPSVKRDPSQLRPMELIAIDDFVLDCNCLFPGDAKNPPQVAQVGGLMAIDVATRRKLMWGMGPQIYRDEKQADGTVRKVRCGIRRVDVQGLLHMLFAKYGLPPYTVTILCENATASISAELELAILALFHGRVRVERTGLITGHTLANGFPEGGGRPWDKGWIESAFNQLWNILGSQPGYKGSNARLNGPADMESKLSYTRLLIGQGDGRKLNLPAEKIALLRTPFPSVQQLEQAFAWACSVCDSREDHRYVGFDTISEFILEEGGEPQPFSALALLPPEQQMAVRVVEHTESPLARWQRLSSTVAFQEVPSSALAIMLLTPKKLVYRANAVSFVHDRVGYSYIDTEGTVLAGAAEGTQYLGYFDPANPESLHLSDLAGAFVGTLSRLGGARGMVDIRDREAMSRTAGQIRTLYNRTIAEVRERHADQDEQLAADRAHNDAIVAAHRAETASLPVADRLAQAGAEAAAEKARAKQQARALRGLRLDTSDLLDDEAQETAATTLPPAIPGNDLLE